MSDAYLEKCTVPTNPQLGAEEVCLYEHKNWVASYQQNKPNHVINVSKKFKRAGADFIQSHPGCASSLVCLHEVEVKVTEGVFQYPSLILLPATN